MIGKPSLQLPLSQTAEPVMTDLPGAQSHETPGAQFQTSPAHSNSLWLWAPLVFFNYLKFNNVSKRLKKPISFVHVLLAAAVFSKASVSLSESAFKFDRQISLVVQGALYQLSLFAEAKPYHSSKGLKKGKHAFVQAWLMWFSVCGIRPALSAALAACAKRCCSPTLAILRWLPVNFRIDFLKLHCLFLTLNGLVGVPELQRTSSNPAF